MGHRNSIPLDKIHPDQNEGIAFHCSVVIDDVLDVLGFITNFPVESCINLLSAELKVVIMLSHTRFHFFVALQLGLLSVAL